MDAAYCQRGWLKACRAVVLQSTVHTFAANITGVAATSGFVGVILGLYRGYIGIMDKKMETTVLLLWSLP